MLNNVVLMGRLTADPELKQTYNGVSVLSFCIAVDRPYSKDGNQQADFINVVAWRQTAEFVSKYFSKGQMIALEGCIQTRPYEDKNGNNRIAFEVIARRVCFCGGKNSDNRQATNGNVTKDNSQPNNQSSPNIKPDESDFDSLDEFEGIGTPDDDLPF
ncbi:single-stranded DNA-binding protein [Massilioclostridium coli]|uniref:single-stranded DNA-binding protein n=1 Tax=Massilioclostridium coli TaxID=1870991 RepID=UPI0022E7047E|nr:single-stranded DNA-binding protein [Massilioclostridium coli]